MLVQQTLFGAFDILDAPTPLQKWDCPWLGQPMPLLGTDNANRRVGCNNYTKGSPHSSRLGGSIFSGRWEIRRCISSLILCLFFIRCNSVPAKSRMGNLIGFQTANLMQNMALIKEFETHNNSTFWQTNFSTKLAWNIILERLLGHSWNAVQIVGCWWELLSNHPTSE